MPRHPAHIPPTGILRFAKLFIALPIVVAPVFSQHSVRPFLLKKPSAQTSPMLDLRPTVVSDTSDQVREGKSTLTAILLSAVVPGAGQMYVERYWTAPIIVGFTAYFIRQWVKADDLYESARERYRQSVEQGVGQGQGSAQFLYERDFYRDQRDKFAFYLALTYLLNIVDAYVGASLYNFEVSDNLNGMEMTLSIPIR